MEKKPKGKNSCGHRFGKNKHTGTFGTEQYAFKTKPTIEKNIELMKNRKSYLLMELLRKIFNR